MALNLSPEKGVKLTKKDKDHVAKKLQQGWKGKVMIPDYVIGEDGNIYVGSENNRRFVKIIKILDDGIYIEKALKSKTLRIVWDKIAVIRPTKKVKDSLEIVLTDGKTVVFEVYNSYKINQIMDYIIRYVQQKKLENNGHENMYN